MSCDICKRKRAKTSIKPSTPVLPLSPIVNDKLKEEKIPPPPPCIRSTIRKPLVQTVVPEVPKPAPSRPIPNIASGVLPVAPLLTAPPPRPPPPPPPKPKSSSRGQPVGTGFAHGMKLYGEIINNTFKTSNYFIPKYSSELRYRDEFEHIILFSLRERRTLYVSEVC